MALDQYINQAADLPAMQHSVMTVDGPLPNGKLGVTLIAETVLGKSLQLGDPPPPLFPELWDKHVTLDTLGMLRRDIWSCRDNWDLTDIDVAVDELRRFKKTGGNTVINATYGGYSDPTSLMEVVARSGVNIIAAFAPRSETSGSSDVRSIRQRLVEEFNEGIDGSTVRPGLIGPISISDPDDPSQLGFLQAVFQVQADIGLSVIVRCNLSRLDALVVSLEKMGANPRRVILDVDVAPDPSSIEFQSSAGGAYGAITYARVLPDGLLRAAEDGFYLAFSSFGFEVYHDRDRTESARDPQRIQGIIQLIERGHLRQILLSNGVRLKTQLCRYGGWGYAHIIENVVPMMERGGLAPKQITSMLTWNPARALAGV